MEPYTTRQALVQRALYQQAPPLFSRSTLALGVVVAAVGLAVVTLTGPTQLTTSIVVLVLLVAALMFDAELGMIPDEISYPLAAFGIVAVFVSGNYTELSIALVCFVMLYVMHAGGFIGGGDMKLLPAAGLATACVSGGTSAMFFLPVALLIGVLAIAGRTSRVRVAVAIAPAFVIALVAAYIGG